MYDFLENYFVYSRLSLVLRKGKDEIERVNNLRVTNNNSLSSSISNSSLNRRQAQTEADTEFFSNPVNESHIRASVIETQMNIEELQQKAKVCLMGNVCFFLMSCLFIFKKKETENAEKDASGTHRTAARKSQILTPNEISLRKVLQTPECLDEAAITINFMTRRLLCEIFDVPVFKDLLKNKIEMKLKEIAVKLFLIIVKNFFFSSY
jgi:hypothetical protein